MPQPWRKANICPIPKPVKDPLKIQSHRPISLKSVMGNLLESTMKQHFNCFLEIKGLCKRNCKRVSEKGKKVINSTPVVATTAINQWRVSGETNEKNGIRPDRLQQSLRFSLEKSFTVENYGKGSAYEDHQMRKNLASEQTELSETQKGEEQMHDNPPRITTRIGNFPNTVSNLNR